MALVTAATPPQQPSGFVVTVLPMLSLGAPIGVVVFRDLDPMSLFHELSNRIRSHLQSLATTVDGHTNTIHVYLYHVDLRLESIPNQTSWHFLSTTPLSQLMHHFGYPAPMRVAYGTTIRDCLGGATDITDLHDPPRVIHLVAEAVEAVHASHLPVRYNRHRQRLEVANPVMFAQLQAFLSSAPEAIPRRSSARLATAPPTTSPHRAPPFVLSNVPAVAGLTLPENKLFVRKADEKLLNEILADLPDKKRFVYVAATTGAGKTAFLWIILHTLCRRGRSTCGTRLAPPMDIVLDVPGLFALIDTAGQIFTGLRGKCFVIEMMKKETLYLVDLAHGDHREVSRPPGMSYCYEDDDDSEDYEASHQDGHRFTHVGYPSRILMCLPRRYVEFIVGQRDKFDVRLLPPWSSLELELCRRVCFPSLEPSLLAARIKLWGQQPQWTLALDKAEGVGEHMLVDRLRDINWLAQIMEVAFDNFIVQPQLDDVTRLLVLCPPYCVKRTWQDRPEWWSFDWCSRRIRDAVLQRVLDLYHGSDQLPPVLQHGAIYYMKAIRWIRLREGEIVRS